MRKYEISQEKIKSHF